MSGHSKWATIKRKKAVTDARRGARFTKITRELSVAARIGGTDPARNPRLCAAVEKARAANLPQDNIRRAIERGAGARTGPTLEEITYGGYGPGGVALLVRCLTDNRNRTVSELRHAFEHHDGALGTWGSVAWLFHEKGYILVDKKKATEEQLISCALEAGAEDVRDDPDEPNFEVVTAPAQMERVRAALDEMGIPIELAEVAMIPEMYVGLEGTAAERAVRLVDALESLDDVEEVFTNFDVPDAALAAEAQPGAAV